MDSKQSLILMFIMQKNKNKKNKQLSGKAKKRRQELIIQLLTVRYFRRTLIQRAQ